MNLTNVVHSLYIRRIPDQRKGMTIPIFSFPYRIGFGHRNKTYGNDFCYASAAPQLSKEHCQIEIGYDGRTYLEDLGSRIGTYVNGKRVSEPRQEGMVELHNGDVIGFMPTFALKSFIGMKAFKVEMVYHNTLEK